GMAGCSSLGFESRRQASSRSHRAPSSTSPCTYTPSGAASTTCSGLVMRVTSVTNFITSSGSLLARAYVCMTAVRKALGLNNPGSHTVTGVMMSPAVQAASCS
ncbi:hypothetical protein Vafri_13810, partial [Volvox africanus]